MATTKFELTISTNYASDWGLVQAIRELFQNAIDQEAQNPTNFFSWEYDKEGGELTISNALSELTPQTLLFGTTTKQDDNKTIGQFGEGYKIATMVLLRMGYTIVFYNNKRDEVWRPRLVQSRRFGNVPVLTFFVEKGLFKRASSNDLDIVVDGISPSDYAILQSYILPLRDEVPKVLLSTSVGDIFEDEEPGHVFVGGLHVQHHAGYAYSYNFTPGLLRLGRDRNLASDFDLKWAASRIWNSLNKSDERYDELVSKAVELLNSASDDVTYINSVNNCKDTNWSDIAYANFYHTNPVDVVPVAFQSDINELPEGTKYAVVPYTVRDLIKSSSLYIVPKRDSTDTLEDCAAEAVGILGHLQDVIVSYQEPESNVADVIEDLLDDLHKGLEEAIALLNKHL